MSRWQAVEREARRVATELQFNLRAEFVSHDPSWREDVLARVRQILAGDHTPPFGDANDD